MAGRAAIVCAMAEEVKPLIRGWRKVRERGLTFFESEKAVVVVAGIGSAPAAMASMILIAREQPSCLLSVGLVGALRRDLHVADVITPRTVINAATGKRFYSRDAGAHGVMVSGRAIAGQEKKQALRAEFGADVVDMESAGVASIADSCGLPFFAIKAVSDEIDFPMPPLNGFVDSTGKFHSLAFAVSALVRPRWWGPTMTLARNGRRASVELCRAVEHQIEQLTRDQSGALAPQG